MSAEFTLKGLKLPDGFSIRVYAGRHMDIIQDSEGALLISNDYSGILYRVTCKKTEQEQK